MSETLRKFIVALGQNAAVTSLSVWCSHPTMRPALEESNIFDTADAARDRLAYLVEASADDACEPGHECGRCVDWPPQIYEVDLSIRALDKEEKVT